MLHQRDEFDIGPLLKQRVLTSDEDIRQQLISYHTRWNDYSIYDEEESKNI